MIVRDLTLVLVWILVAESFIQGITHLISWTVLRRQEDQTRFGTVLRRRELMLGIKNFARVMFDVLLAISVTWYTHPHPEGTPGFTGNPILPPVFVVVIGVAMVVIWYAIQFVRALVHQSALLPIQEDRQVKQDARSERQDARGDRQDRREHRQDQRESRIDDKESDVVPVPVALEKVVEAISHIEQIVTDVPEIRDDVKQVRKKIEGE